jgi:glycosyltransferase involved in cell wall biosynthesis
MRIFYDHQAFSLQSHGGITQVFSQIIRYLNVQSDISTDIFLGFSSTRADFRSIIAPPGRVFHPGPGLARRSIFNYAVNEAISALVTPFWGKYDIYHNSLYRFLPSVRAKRRVATHHDCVQETFPDLFPDSARIIKFKRRMFRRADLIICVSLASQRDLLHFYDVAPEKTIVVYNGVSGMERQPHSEDELRAVVQGEFLLHVGARHRYKNFDGLLRAYSASGLKEDYSLLVLGGGAATAAERVMIADLGLARRVRFVPYASTALLAEAYAQARVLVYPSLYEGFGMPPLEAASVGGVSLVAANPATLEICRDAVFYFDPSDPEDFLRMLSRAVTDIPEREARIQRAHPLLRDYTWENCGRNTLAAYRSLC